MQPLTNQVLKLNPSMLLAEFILLEAKPEVPLNLIIENLKQLKEIQFNQWPVIDHKAQILGIDSSPPLQELGLLAKSWRSLNRKLWTAFDPAFVEKILKAALTVLSNAYTNPKEIGSYEPEASEINELIRPALEGVQRMMKTYSQEGKAATSYNLNFIYHNYLQKVIFLARQRSMLCLSQSPSIPIPTRAEDTTVSQSPDTNLSGSYTKIDHPINLISLLKPAPPIPNLEHVINIRTFPNKEILIEKLKPLFISNLPLLKSTLNLKSPVHLRRSQIQSSLPLEIDSQGKVYAILKQCPHGSPIKKGSYKMLFGALDLDTKTVTAWAKIFIPKSNTSVALKLMLMKEMSIQRQLNSPQIVKILHEVTYQNKKGEEVFGIMFEFCEANLDEFLNNFSFIQEQKQNQQDLWNIFEDILMALTVLEESDIHHRDLKPANILLTKNGGWRAKLGDFGFATLIDDEIKSPLFCGSPLYMAPEFYTGYMLIMFGWNLTRTSKDNKLNYPFTYEELMTSRNNIIAHAAHLLQSDLIKKFEIPLEKMSDKERVEFGIAIYKIGIQLGISLKGDIWAMGLILYRMRTGKTDRAIFNNSVCLKTPEDFCKEILRLTSQKINLSFSPNIIPGSLEDLNRRMLTIDPSLRPNASECLQIIRHLKAKGAHFS